MKKLLTFILLISVFSLTAQVKTYKDSNTGDQVNRLIVNTNADGQSNLGFVTGSDTTWIETYGSNINIKGDTVRINGVVYLGEQVISEFNGDRTVSRSGLPLVNAGGETLEEWVENYFFPFLNPTISINSNVVVEIGTNNAVPISGTITPYDESAFTSGMLIQTYPTVDTVYLFTTATTYTTSVEFNPRQAITVNGAKERRFVSYSKGTDCDCTINSSTKYLTSVYPYLYGITTSTYESSGAYSGLTKLIEAQGEKSITFTGAGYIYFAFPASYDDLESIKDQNGFEQLNAFTKYTVNVTSTGLEEDWTESYKVYRLKNTTTATGWKYTFK